MNAKQDITEIGSFPIDKLLNLIDKLTEKEWDYWKYRRRNFYETAYTRSIPFLWPAETYVSDGNVVKYDNFEKYEHYIKDFHDYIIKNIVGENTIKKMFLNKLLAKKYHSPWYARGEDLQEERMCILSLSEDKKHVYYINDNPYFLEPGRIYEIDSSWKVSTSNKSDKDFHTIHFNWVKKYE